jgi:hypothetical protein
MRLWFPGHLVRGTLPIARFHFDVVLLVLPKHPFGVYRQSISPSFDVGDLNQSIGDVGPILPSALYQPLGTYEPGLSGRRDEE